MEVSQDIRGFRSEKADGRGIFVEQTKEMKVMGVRGLLSYDQFGEEEHGRRKGRKDFKVLGAFKKIPNLAKGGSL